MTSNTPATDTTPSLISPSVTPKPAPDTPPVKLGIMVSGSGSNFEAIAQAIADGQLHAQIQVMIYNNPGIKALARAEKFSIPTVLHNHRDYKKREALDAQIVQTLRHTKLNSWLWRVG